MITSLLILRVNFFFYLQDHLAYIHLAFRQIRLRLTFFIFDAFEVFVLFHFEATFRHLSPSPEFYVVELFVPTTTAQEKQGSEAARERASWIFERRHVRCQFTAKARVCTFKLQAPSPLAFHLPSISLGFFSQLSFV